MVAQVTKERIDYLDFAKAIGITLVVLRHCGISIGVFAMFHMPLFFMISGMFFKEGKTFGGLTKNKLNRLVVPWAFFYLLGCLFFYVAASIEPSLKDNYIGFFDVFVHRATFNYPIWFLLSLFWVFIMYFIVCKTHSLYIRTTIVFVLSICGCFLGYQHIFLPCYVDIALSSLFFFHVGYMVYTKTKLFSFDKKTDVVIGLILAFVTLIAYYYINPKIWLADNLLNPLCYIFSTTGVLALLFLIKHVRVSHSILYIGKHSLVILCWHNFFQRSAEVVLNHVNISDSYLQWGVFLCAMSLSIIMIPISLRIIPWFVGKKDIIK